MKILKTAAITAFAVALLAAAVYLFPASTIGWLGYILTADQDPRPSDAIVMMLGGECPERPIKAAELYREKLAPRIVMSSGYINREVLKSAPAGYEWLPISGRFITALRSLGVSRDDIHIVDSSHAFDSAYELAAVADYLRKNGWKRAILVTTVQHTRRVNWIWSRVAPDIEHTTVAANLPRWDKWWQDPAYVRLVGYEYFSLLKEVLRRAGVLE